MHKIFRECFVGTESSLTDMRTINDVVMKVVELLQRREHRRNTEADAYQSAVMEQIRATSITTPTAIIIFSESLYLGALTKKRNPTKHVYLVRLQSGIITRIGDTPKPLKQYEYMVHALFAITVQTRLTRGRGRFSLANVNRNKPWYFVDTEFTSRWWLKSGTIYDIALINGFDPYASTVSYLACDRNYFRPMDGTVIQYSDLEGAPTVDELYDFFSYLSLNDNPTDETARTKPVIWYFSTAHDISPFYEQHEHYDHLREDLSSPPKETPRINPWKFDTSLEYDFEFRDARVGNTAGTMSKLYESQQNTSIGSYKHIRLHTAISDALLLTEFVLTRELGREM